MVNGAFPAVGVRAIRILSPAARGVALRGSIMPRLRGFVAPDREGMYTQGGGVGVAEKRAGGLSGGRIYISNRDRILFIEIE